ncbi:MULTISPECIES: glycosyltransferase [unclassified Micromonospora]|uniref:glycosyltransferase n=1 Tax=unclassified Micromonospora TaxID=2617518 RepID=UPI002FEF7F61
MRIQVFEQARTAHLDRLALLPNTQLFFRHRSFDFDEAQASKVDATQMSRTAMIWRLAQSTPEVIEVNEPMFLRAWPTIIAAYCGALLASLRSRRRVRIVCYAIENGDAEASFARHFRIAHVISRLLFRLAVNGLVSRVDGMAFGTEGAAANYSRFVASRHRLSLATFSPLEPACSCDDSIESHGVLFVGALEQRKGVAELMAAWESVTGDLPGVTLTVVGKGQMEDVITEWIRTQPSARLVVDLERSDLHHAYRSARVLVLPSLRTPHWREQVGLPIVEALAHGCEIVTTDETGLADWLDRHGHRVVPSELPVGALSAAIREAWRSARPRSEILSSLPERDGRNLAAEWLFAKPDNS